LLPPRSAAPLAHGPWLRLARDYLLAQGAHIQTEEASRIVAELPDGAQVAYTDAPDGAQDGSLLLVPGSAAVAEVGAEIEARSRVGALRLASAVDALALAASFSAHRAGRKPRSQLGAAVSLGEGALTIHWEKPPTRATVSRPRERATIELEYRLAGRDHFGRIEDTLRVSVDPTDEAEGPALDLLQLSAAQSAPLAPADRAMLKTILERTDERLRPGLEAFASFLRLRSEGEYRRRVETAQGVAERARRERPEEARQTAQALKQEVATLGAVFAVEVEGAVTAAWVVYTPVADVVYHLPGGSTVAVTLDLGRAAANPVACMACQRATREVSICAHAHILCLACRDWLTEPCAICAGSVASLPTPAPMRVVRKDASSVLTLAALTRLGPAMWRASAGWLLERQGYTLSALASDTAAVCWRGVDADGGALFLRALRGNPSRTISERDIAETSLLARAQRVKRAVLLAAGSPTRSAQRMAEASDVRIVDGEALRSQLAALAESVDGQQEGALAETRARAKSASAANAAMQKALASAAKRLDATPSPSRASGSATLAKAQDQLRAARTAADQAYLAWDTLLSDWLDGFGSAPAHDGSLPMLADADEFTSLRERAAHLGIALTAVLRDITATPGDGEMGYGAWRAAVVEEERLRCVALELRLRMIDPAEWADFDAARSQERAAEASQAEIAARRASARADKAQSQVTQLAG
jgi:hypothetical protein